MFGEGPDLVACVAACRAGDPVTARALALAARRGAELRGDPVAAAVAAAHVAWTCFQVGDVETGRLHAGEARAVFAAAGLTRREALVCAIQAWLLLETGLTEAAVEEALKAVARAERLDDPAAESWAANVLAVVFWACKQLDRAEALSLRAVALARDMGDLQILAWWLINLAGIRAEVGYRSAQCGDRPAAWAAFGEALVINGDALAIALPSIPGTPGTHSDPWCARLALCNAAEYHTARGELDEAGALLDRWGALPFEPGGRSSAHYLYQMSSLLVRRGRGLEALPVCERALALADETDNTDSRSHALRTMSEIHESLGRFDLALAAYKAFHETQSTLAAEQVQRRARLAEIHYETDRLKRDADDLARANRVDPLTGIGNRRLLDETLESLRRTMLPFCIAVVDLDHFKRINDGFSHATGDAVLRRVGGALREAVRAGDAACRMGGEEFVLVLPGADRGAALAVCGRAMEALGEIDWTDLHPALRVTASVGVASHADALDPAGVLAVADQRLYQAKQAGRDRIVSFPIPALDRRRPARSRPAVN